MADNINKSIPDNPINENRSKKREKNDYTKVTLILWRSQRTLEHQEEA
jgi:hypothetical protein